MYVPSIHKPGSEIEIHDYIRKNGFATLVSLIEGTTVATHIPLYLDKMENGKFRLLGHFAAANEQKLSLGKDADLLAIFMETHAYVSSSWYDHINVPTWNYIAVHVYGKSRILKGAELYTSITKLVDQYEHGRPERFRLSDMTEDMKKAHFAGLIGFEMSIDKIESSYKLSQNRKDHDYKNIIERLEEEGDNGSTGIADKMKKLRP